MVVIQWYYHEISGSCTLSKRSKTHQKSVSESERHARVVSVRIDPQARAALDRTAATWGLSRSATVARLAVEQDQRNAPSPPDPRVAHAAHLLANASFALDDGSADARHFYNEAERVIEELSMDGSFFASSKHASVLVLLFATLSEMRRKLHAQFPTNVAAKKEHAA